MTPFLRQVASHYFNEEGLDRICFLFPNRRAQVFFRKYLSEEVRDSGVPVKAPLMLSVNDFFFRVSGLEQTDRIQLLITLYDCYKRLYPNAEPLDEFIFWGDVILADFDDVDKYLVNAGSLFTNVEEFKNMEDDYSYLSDRQREAILNFLSHFRDGSILKNTPDKTGRNVKGRFLKIWDILHPLYLEFGKVLRESGLSYEGQAYRQLAESLRGENARPVSEVLGERFKGVGRFVFVGLNALNECEKTTMRKMRDAGLAEFCWDFCSSYVKDSDNKSSFFMKDNIAEFPQAFAIDTAEELPATAFHALAVPSATGQAKQLPEIFRKMGITPGTETAVVLPDENLLIPVMNSIPPEVKKVNVTMGYPIGGSEFHSLLNEAGALQLHIRKKDGKNMFYHRQVWGLLSNSVLKSVLTEEDRETVKKIRKEVKYYIPESDFAESQLLRTIFRTVVTDPQSKEPVTSGALPEYYLEIISTVGSLLGKVPGMAVEQEFAREYYLAVGKIRNLSPDILPATWIRLVEGLASTVSVPFKGEPLNGLQIMGPLETRALDFENVIILSCNEGVFPRHSVSSSFIPHELRKGFGLPTYEYQDAIWAYYFYRMIQRASNVWMVYDSRPEVSRSGEESRYVKQLEMHFGAEVERLAATAAIGRTAEPAPLEKTDEDILAIRRNPLSASSLQDYLACPARFYYKYVVGLSKPDEVAESLDGGMMGSVFHRTMENLYKDRSTVSREWLSAIKEREVKALVRQAITEVLKTGEITGRNIIYEDMTVRYVMKTLARDVELMDAYGTDSFSILGMECRCTGYDKDGFRFKGFIDRIDSFRDGEIRIVDYKTGHVSDNDVNINDDNAEKIAESVFSTAIKEKDRPKIALQLYLYDEFAKELPFYKGQTLVNSIYQTSRLFVEGVKNVSLSEKFREEMDCRLSALLKEIADPGTGFDRRSGNGACDICDFKMICGK